MNPKKIFLTAAWKHLVMANYQVDPSLLKSYLPAHTELDIFQDKVLVSLVGFMFEKVKIKGFSIPFHTHFPEVNLRFYVKHIAANGTVQRGVVFISEIVPRPAIAWVANNIYKEKYIATRMKTNRQTIGDTIQLYYGWIWKGRTNSIAAEVGNMLTPITPQSEEEFIFEHYHGFAKVNDQITNQYTVEHPSWKIYPVQSYNIDCRFEEQYGSAFSFLDHTLPGSVFVAEGSPVLIREKSVLI